MTGFHDGLYCEGLVLKLLMQKLLSVRLLTLNFLFLTLYSAANFAAGPSARLSSMICAIVGRHFPHCGFSPQRRKTSPTLQASLPAAAANFLSFNALQIQIIINSI